MLSAGPTHLSNLAKILLQHFLKMDPPTTAFVPRPVTTAQGIYSNLKSNLLFGCILGISCKGLITKKCSWTPSLLSLKYIPEPLLSLDPEVEAPLTLNLCSGYHCGMLEPPGPLSWLCLERHLLCSEVKQQLALLWEGQSGGKTSRSEPCYFKRYCSAFMNKTDKNQL